MVCHFILAENVPQPGEGPWGEISRLVLPCIELACVVVGWQTQDSLSLNERVDQGRQLVVRYTRLKNVIIDVTAGPKPCHSEPKLVARLSKGTI
jgi:hypothetical protein